MTDVGFDVFVALWNRHQNLETPAVHVDMARWLERRWRVGDRRLLLMAFRNSGKSTLVGLFSAWLLRNDSNLRILVMAAELSLARKMVRNTKRIIERHPLTTGMKPARADQWASEHFTVNRSRELRDASMQAKGIGANVTGGRADVIVCDDVEVPKTCATAHLRADLRNRLADLDYVLAPGGTQIYVGTPHTYYSIYGARTHLEAGEQRPFLDGYRCLKLPLLDATGRSRWPGRFPDAEIEHMRRRSGPNKFRSQMQLEPLSDSEGRLDPDQLRPYDDDLDYVEGNGESFLRIGGVRMVSASSFWDPAYGAPGRGDGSVVAVVYTDDQGGYWLHCVVYLTHDPALVDTVDEATQQCRQVAAFAATHHLPAVVLETNGLGKFLPSLLRREVGRMGLRCTVVERSAARSKDTRIVEAFDAPLAAGRLHAHRSVWRTPFITEMREWRPNGGRLPDDGLDAVSGCLLNESVRLPRLAPAPGRQQPTPNWRPGKSTYTATTNFEI